MKLLITGANGLLGQKIVTLTEGLSNLQVIATSRGKNRNPKGRYAYRHLDVTDNQAVYDHLKKELPDVIINCAAVASTPMDTSSSTPSAVCALTPVQSMVSRPATMPPTEK